VRKLAAGNGDAAVAADRPGPSPPRPRPLPETNTAPVGTISRQVRKPALFVRCGATGSAVAAVPGRPRGPGRLGAHGGGLQRRDELPLAAERRTKPGGHLIDDAT
jgi:hypothetical protein